MPEPSPPASAESGAPDPVPLSIRASPGLVAWLRAADVSLALTTYQMGKLFLIGVTEAGELSVVERHFPRCMGMTTTADGQIWMSSLNQMYRLINAIPKGEWHEGRDAVFVPRQSWVTGDLDIHDIVEGPDGRPIFVNTRFNCLATLSDGYSFAEVWRPPFVSALVAEDRCHLNGLAAENGVPRLVTLAGRSDSQGGWRAGRVGGGLVLDVATGETVAAGLTMPHSPRLVDGALYMLNSGEGQFGRCDLASGRFEPIAFCPGFARGLAFVGDTAVIGLSKPRRGLAFDGLPLDDALPRHGAQAICGLIFVDLRRGTLHDWLRLDGPVQELYDVVALPGLRCPSAMAFQTDDINRMITVGRSRPDVIPRTGRN